MSDTPRTDDLYQELMRNAQAPATITSVGAMLWKMRKHAQKLEHELNAIRARAKAECDNWLCHERDGKEWCPNCPYELVIREET